MENIFLCGHRKSGTTLLLNLLDGHNEIQTYPEDLCLMYGYFPHHIKELTSEEELEARLDSVVFKMLDKKSVKRGYRELLPIEKFKSLFTQKMEGLKYSRIEDVLPALLSSFESLDKTKQKKLLAVKETSIEIYADEIREIFPDAKFVHLVRDPRDNYAAIKSGVGSYYSKLGENELESLASVLNRAKLGLKLAQVNESRFGSDFYHVVRFEDLVSNLSEEMMRLCNFLNVPHSDSVMMPTIFGVPQAGNNHEGKKMFNVSSENIGKWRARISEQEAQIIEFFLSEEMSQFGYERVFSDSECTRAISEYYKWNNYRYFYRDSFTSV